MQLPGIGEEAGEKRVIIPQALNASGWKGNMPHLLTTHLSELFPLPPLKPEDRGVWTSTWISVQFSSVTQLCLTLCNPIDCSMPGFPVHHQLLELTQLMSIESVMPSNHLIPLSSPSPPAFNLSQHQGLFQWVSSLHQVAKVLEFQLQHQSFQWIFRTDFL